MNKPYVLKYPTGEFVSLDSMSGGYPQPTTNIRDIECWESAEEADRYRQTGGNHNGFTIHKITGLVTEPVIETSRVIPVFSDPVSARGR